MNTLEILEQKVTGLVAMVKNLKDLNNALQVAQEMLKAENQELKIENAKLIEENAHLSIQLQATEDSASRETREIETLHKEKERTKTAVDDLLSLIQGIDTLIESEAQQ